MVINRKYFYWTLTTLLAALYFPTDAFARMTGGDCDSMCQKWLLDTVEQTGLSKNALVAIVIVGCIGITLGLIHIFTKGRYNR